MHYDLESFFVTMEQLGITVNVKRYMEIGVQDGDSTIEVLKKYNPERVVLCDNWGPGHGGTDRGSHEYAAKRFVEVGFDMTRILWLDGESQELVPRYFELYPAADFDLILVDDDHSARTLTGHLNTLLGHANFIACHDACMEGIKAAANLKYLEWGEEYILVTDGLTQSRFVIFVRRERL